MHIAKEEAKHFVDNMIFFKIPKNLKKNSHASLLARSQDT